MHLNGKRILLTGATGGLGEELAKLLAKKEAVLTLVGRDEAKLNHLKDALERVGCKSFCIVADLTEKDVSTRIVAEATQRMGGIDMLINNAGVLDFVKFEQQADERISQMIHTNVTTPIQLTRAIIGDLQAKNRGHIVLIGSIFGSLGFPYFTTYCASKFAVHGFSQALRRELQGTNIGVTYIAPRGIKTAMNDANTVAMWNKTGNQMDDPQAVAKLIVKALEKEQEELFIGQPQSFFAWLNGVFPKLVSNGLKKTTLIARQFL
jgi:short-subunit dehydrogenase